MRIKEALPDLFRKAYPVLDPKTEMLSALSLLRFHEIDALPLSFDSAKKNRAVTGFSSLARLTRLNRKGLPKFLSQPCEQASEPLASVGADRSLSVLLDKFVRTRFGFAKVEDKKKVGTLASLWDLLGLYETGQFETDLSVEDVASPIFSLSRETSARQALKEMFDRSCRRIFITGSRRFVWDRGIIERLFSPEALGKTAEDPSKDFLGIPLSEFEMMAPGEVKPSAKLRDAAHLLKLEPGHCLISDGKVVTPWDVVMNPWKASALKLSAN